MTAPGACEANTDDEPPRSVWMLSTLLSKRVQ